MRLRLSLGGFYRDLCEIVERPVRVWACACCDKVKSASLMFLFAVTFLFFI
jgi:hypothetical protein